MELKRFCVMFVFILICLCLIEAKKKQSKNTSNNSLSRRKTKTKTKWSTSTDLSGSMSNSIVATEEHGYYIKRTFVPWNNKSNGTAVLKSPPFLAVPIAWFQCHNKEENINNCFEHFNAMLLNGRESALNQGYLCDDDCEEAYDPICGKTFSEVAVFYNKCKLKVAKCRSHGLWIDFPFEECKKKYPEEVLYAEKKFYNSPYFRTKDVIDKLPSTTTTTTTPRINTESSTEKIFMQEIGGDLPEQKFFNATDVYEKMKS